MEQHQYPFNFDTEASIDLAQDAEMMELMVDCGFKAVFLAIETPDEDSLQLTKKFQNTRSSLAESVETIIKAGLRPMAGFIIGFDGEKTGAGDRIVRFAELAAIPSTTFAMLQALPNTALWHRLKKEGRLRENQDGNINQTTLMNFIPTRPLEELAREYVEAFCALYDPVAYLDRTYRCFMMLGSAKYTVPAKMPEWVVVRALLIVIWRQGFKRQTRWKFWHHFFSILKHNPKVVEQYVSTCAHIEHFMEYRQIVRDEIESQLAAYLAQGAEKPYILVKEKAAEKVEAVI